MLTMLCDGIWVRQSDFCQSNAVIVAGPDGALLIDPGVHGDDLLELADDLAGRELTVAAGFATHPHWDHLLWHPAFGSVPRYGTARCADAAGASLEDATAMAELLISGAPLDLLGQITAWPPDAGRFPWDGPRIQILEHQGHAPGHAALLIEPGVLVAGDMLSDVEIPLLDLSPGVRDPLGDYRDGLELLAGAADDVTVLVPGHGSWTSSPAVLRARIDADHAYLDALAAGASNADPRVAPGAAYGADWLPGEHQRQLERLSRAEPGTG